MGMLRDRLLDIYCDFRDFAESNRRIVMPLVLLGCVVLTAGISFTLRRSAGRADPAAVSSAQSQENPLELNAFEEVNALIGEYYRATADGDAETIAQLCSALSEEEIIRIRELGNYIDTYTEIEIYTKTGPVDGSYIAYVCVTLTLVDHDWEIPGLQTLYICTGGDGTLYINSDGTQSEEVVNYISLASLQDDVVDLNNQTAAAYNEMLEEDEELADYLDQIASVIDISVGQQLAALEESRTDTGANAVYVEAIADDINIRKSASEDGTKIGTAQSGDQFQLVEELTDGWTEILYNGQNAFVKSDYVVIMDSEAADTEASDTEDTETETADTENTDTEAADTEAVNTEVTDGDD